MRATSSSWTQAAAPGVKTAYPFNVLRAMKRACIAVDREVERTGTVSAESVDKVRAALVLANQYGGG